MNAQIRTKEVVEGPDGRFGGGQVWYVEVVDEQNSVVWQSGPHLSESGAALRGRQWARRHGLNVLEPTA